MVRSAPGDPTLPAVPRLPAGDQWLREHTAPDAAWWGRALVVEPRYVADIIAGAQADGLEVA